MREKLPHEADEQHQRQQLVGLGAIDDAFNGVDHPCLKGVPPSPVRAGVIFEKCIANENSYSPSAD